MDVQILVDNRVSVIDPDIRIKEYAKSLELINPEFVTKERMGLYAKNLPRTIKLYEVRKKNKHEVFIFPFGCLTDIWKICRFEGIFNNELKLHNRAYYESNIKPYKYQECAINKAINTKNGIIVMPCGAGKTQTALEIVARLGLKTLWITHTSDLLSQSKNRAIKLLEIDGNFGEITGGKINIGTHITFSTIQTLSKIDLADLKNEWDCIIVDECHKCVGAPTKLMMFYKVLNSLAARYKIGITATPTRQDGLERSMYAILGPKIYEVTKEDVKENTVPVYIKTQYTEYSPDIYSIVGSDGVINYNKAIEHMVNNTKRNNTIKALIEDIVDNGGSVLVLSDRINHLQTLHNISNPKSVVLSLDKKKDREKTIKRMQDGDLKVLFASYSLAKEGLDIPKLTHIILATPKRDEATVIQSAGRVSRKHENKQNGLVIDLVDNFIIYERMHKERQRAFRKAGYELL